MAKRRSHSFARSSDSSLQRIEQKMIISKARLLVPFLFLLTLPVFSQGEEYLFPIVKNKRVGYIDRTGKVRVEPQFADGWKFSEGLACVVTMDGLSGFIDVTGKLVIPS